MKHPYDPQLVEAAMTAISNRPDLGDISNTRRKGLARFSEQVIEMPEGVTVEPLTVPRISASLDLDLRIYTPATRIKPIPALIYIHGGGFVGGRPEWDDLRAAVACSEVGIVVVSVDYRRAPEHPFPAALDDCFDALNWLAARAHELDVDTDRIGVWGESAGGCLAAALALLTRDRRGPQLCIQVLDVPVLDDRLRTNSMLTLDDAPGLTRKQAGQMWEHYLGGGSLPRAVNHHAVPARAIDLRSVAPAYIATAEFDTFRDEGIEYAQRLMHAGVSTELHNYAGTFHGSERLGPDASVSKLMISDRLAAMRRSLLRHRTATVQQPNRIFNDAL